MEEGEHRDPAQGPVGSDAGVGEDRDRGRGVVGQKAPGDPLDPRASEPGDRRRLRLGRAGVGEVKALLLRQFPQLVHAAAGQSYS